jgi:hypothetical protein
MAITFTTKAAGDVTMLDANARQMLELIGKDFGVRGVITAAEAGAAAAKLRAAASAVQSGKTLKPEEEQQAEAAGADTVPLHTRFKPFVDMLDAAAQQNKDILWGV